MSYKSVLLGLAVLGAAAALPTASKTVILEKQIATNEIAHGGLGASASWGPFSAGAGLGGGANGGGLYAGASSPQGSAGAGLGGGGSSSASASASASAGAGAGATGAGGVGVQPQGAGFFDRIFNIPISILQSVNQNLNANGGIKKRVYVSGHAGANGGAVAPSGAGAQASANAGAGAGVPLADRSASSATASASAGAGAGSVPPGGARKDYDAIFNIPITALRSVNDFLNGK